MSQQHIICDEPILQFADTAFELTQLHIPGNRNVFNIIYQLSSFNPEHWPDKIKLEEGENGFHFISLCKDGTNEVMTLTTGKRNIKIAALYDSLEINIE